MAEKKVLSSKFKHIKSLIKIYTKVFAPFLIPVLFIAYFISPYLYQHRLDKEIRFYQDQIKAVGKEHGSFIPLVTASSLTSRALYYNALTMEDTNAPLSIKKNAELSSLLTKLDILKLTLTAHPEKINDTWEILLLNEIINLSNKNKQLQVTYEIEARYAAITTRQEILDFELFYFASLAPPSIEDFKPRIINDNKKSYDYSSEAIGSTNDLSLLYMTCVKIPARDLNNDKIKFKVYFPVLKQSFPFSLHDIPINRYVRGVRKLVAAFSFSDKVFINNYVIDMNDIEAKNFSEEYGDYLYNKKLTVGNDLNGYSQYAFEIRNPNNPIAIAYLRYDERKFLLSEIPVPRAQH